jgi:hypothetical protein
VKTPSESTLNEQPGNRGTSFVYTGNICYCRLEAPFALGTSAPASLSDTNASMYLEWHQDAYRIAAGAAEKLCSWLRSVMESQIKDALPEIQ